MQIFACRTPKSCGSFGAPKLLFQKTFYLPLIYHRFEWLNHCPAIFRQLDLRHFLRMSSMPEQWMDLGICTNWTLSRRPVFRVQWLIKQNASHTCPRSMHRSYEAETKRSKRLGTTAWPHCFSCFSLQLSFPSQRQSYCLPFKSPS